MGNLAHLFAEDDAAPAAGMAVRLNADANPDQAAKNNALAKRFGLPTSVVETFPDDYRAKAAAEDAQAVLKSAPRLGSWVSEKPERAKIAHDDIDTLGGMEQAIRTMRNLPAAVASAFPRAGASIYAGAAAPFEIAGQVLNAAGAEDNIASSVGGMLRRQAQSAEDVSAGIYTAPKDAGLIERGIGSGVQSATQTLLTLPIALRQGGEKVALGLMGAMTGGLSYLKGRREGLDPAQATVYGVQDATAEIVTERLPMLRLVGDLKAGTGAARTVINFLKKEVPGEIAATVWQNFNEWANVNPDKPLAEWLAEQPEAIAETIVATLVGGGAQVGVGKGIQRLMDAGDKSGAADRAEQIAAQAEMLSRLGEASKLKGRDAESFRELVAQIAEEDGEAPTEFYIDGQTLLNTLNQSGISREEIAAIAPVVAAQLDAAEASDVRVPVSEFMAAGEKFTAPLIDHLRTEPDGMTRAEAKQFMAEQGDTLRAEVEAELSKMDEQTTFRESIAGVQAQFEGELNAAKRFKPDVNRAYASLLANFYGATAARLGMTPEALLDKYRLGVQAKAAAGDRTMEQAPRQLAEVRAAWDAAGIRSSITESGDMIELGQIIVPEGARERGIGTTAMRQLLAYADATGKRVVLTPSSDFGGNKARLVKFYKGLGFKENKGRSRDFTTRAGMVRDPQAALDQSAMQADAAREQTTELRKREAVLKRLMECI